VIKRTLGAEPSYAYAISNAPASTLLSTFVWLSGLRWAVEQCFAAGKTELGMDHYEVRTYAGWHHHMLTTMLAHFLPWHLKLRLGKKAPALTVSQLRRLLDAGLPLRTVTVDGVLELVAWVQRRNHRAYLAHRKRRETEG
jgi:SRSO17 transposase